MRALLLFLLVTPFESVVASDAHNPFLMVPITEEFLNHAVVRAFFVDILQQGGIGYRQTEAAAFLVLDSDRDYRCVSWSFHGRVHRQQFRGKAPDQTIAIVHTHPEGTPRPSPGDRQMARSLGIPIFVLTRNNIYMVDADGHDVPVVKSRFWATDPDIGRRCEAR